MYLLHDWGRSPESKDSGQSAGASQVGLARHVTSHSLSSAGDKLIDGG